MDDVWISSVHNLHCPRCGARLVQRAARCLVEERAAPVYVGAVGTLACACGHSLPARDTLYAYRDERGNPRTAPVSEVASPTPARARA